MDVKAAVEESSVSSQAPSTGFDEDPTYRQSATTSTRLSHNTNINGRTGGGRSKIIFGALDKHEKKEIIVRSTSVSSPSFRNQNGISNSHDTSQGESHSGNAGGYDIGNNSEDRNYSRKRISRLSAYTVPKKRRSNLPPPDDYHTNSRSSHHSPIPPRENEQEHTHAPQDMGNNIISSLTDSSRGKNDISERNILIPITAHESNEPQNSQEIGNRVDYSQNNSTNIPQNYVENVHTNEHPRNNETRSYTRTPHMSSPNHLHSNHDDNRFRGEGDSPSLNQRRQQDELEHSNQSYTHHQDHPQDLLHPDDHNDPYYFESLPEGVQLPPSVDSDLLGERLLNMLLKLPVSQINEALTEYDDAVRVKSNIRNHQAYLHGVLKRYLSVLEKSRESGAKPMGNEITDKVMLRMKNLVDDDFCTDDELLHNERILSKIKMLPEHEALSAIEELAGANRSQIRNFGSYFMGILNRYMRGEKLTVQRGLRSRENHGYRDYRSRRPADDDRWDEDRSNLRRRSYQRERSWSPDRDNRPSRRDREYYRDVDPLDLSERDRYAHDEDYEHRPRRKPFRKHDRARDYSPPQHNTPVQEQSDQVISESINQPRQQLDEAQMEVTGHHPDIDVGAASTELHKEEQMESSENSSIPNGNTTTITISDSTTLSTNRPNPSLPTSRWQPPSEIHKTADVGDFRPPGGLRKMRPSHTFDRRPSGPLVLDISEPIQSAIKNLSTMGFIEGNLGYSIHRMISELPEDVALDAIAAFCKSDMGRVRNREGYLVGILKKHALKIGVTFSR